MRRGSSAPCTLPCTCASASTSTRLWLRAAAAAAAAAACSCFCRPSMRASAPLAAAQAPAATGQRGSTGGQPAAAPGPQRMTQQAQAGAWLPARRSLRPQPPRLIASSPRPARGSPARQTLPSSGSPPQPSRWVCSRSPARILCLHDAADMCGPAAGLLLFSVAAAHVRALRACPLGQLMG